MNGYQYNGNKNSVKPKTYYEELAEMGMLEEFLATRFKFSFENDEKFRNEMLRILYEKSPKAVPEVEKLYLEKLSDSLKYLLEQTKKWKKPTP